MRGQAIFGNCKTFSSDRSSSATRDHFSVDPSWLSVEAAAPAPPDTEISRRSPAEEKAAIEAALEASGGRVSGPSGAAAQLGIPASTLESRIRALRINKFRFKSV